MYNYILLITILKYLKKSASFLSDFCCNNNKNKLEQKKPPAFFKILKEPILVQKKYMPHMKALILSFFEPEQQGRGIIMGAPRPPPVKVVIYFLSEAVEAKWGWWNKNQCFISNPRIPKNQLLITTSLIHEKLLVWNVSKRVQCPCTWVSVWLKTQISVKWVSQF